VARCLVCSLSTEPSSSTTPLFVSTSTVSNVAVFSRASLLFTPAVIVASFQADATELSA
jgi:hypothetical protein